MKDVHIKDYRLCYSFRFYKTRNQKLLKKLSWKTAMRMGFAQFKTFKFIELWPTTAHMNNPKP